MQVWSLEEAAQKLLLAAEHAEMARELLPPGERLQKYELDNLIASLVDTARSLAQWCINLDS